MKRISPSIGPKWLGRAVAAIAYEGVVIVDDVLSADQVAEGRAAVARAMAAIRKDLPADRFQAAVRSGSGEWRLPFAYEPHFFEVLDIDPVLAMVEAILGPAAILRYQNFQVVARQQQGSTVFRQQHFHQNNATRGIADVLSLEVLIPLTPIDGDRRDFVVVPGTHRRPNPPDEDYLEWAAEPIAAPAGSAVLFDSSLWHRETLNHDDEDRVFIVEQFTRSFLKPHFDFVRVLGTERVRELPERLRRLLGWNTRLPTSLAEFYLPPEERLYQPDQD